MSKPSFPRTRRINAIIREVLAEEVEELADPRLGMVTITGVEVAPDMRRAIVYVSALDQDHLDETIRGLTAAAPRLRAARSRLGSKLFSPLPTAIMTKGMASVVCARTRPVMVLLSPKRA